MHFLFGMGEDALIVQHNHVDCVMGMRTMSVATDLVWLWGGNAQDSGASVLFGVKDGRERATCRDQLS